MDLQDVKNFEAALFMAVYGAPGHRLHIDDAFTSAESVSKIKLLSGDRHALMLKIGLARLGDPAEGIYVFPETLSAISAS